MVEKDQSSWSLDEWAARFHGNNSQWFTRRRAADAWLGFVENATTRIAEFVRREEHAKTVEALGKAFGWLCCFVQEYRTSAEEKFTLPQPLSAMVWRKYPGVCYYCVYRYSRKDVQSRSYLPCQCLGAPRRTKKQAENAKNKLVLAAACKTRPQGLDDWAAMIRGVYGGAHKELSLPAICLHFLEEVGEVAKALSEISQLRLPEESASLPRKVEELEEELADVFSWIFGLINKLDQILEKARAFYSGKKLGALSATEIVSRAFERPITSAIVE